MSSIKITADSTCDLAKELTDKYNITIVPLYINMDDNSYKDGIDVKPEQVYEYFEKTGSLATTSAVTVEDYREVFSRYSSDGFDVIHLNIGAEFLLPTTMPGMQQKNLITYMLLIPKTCPQAAVIW